MSLIRFDSADAYLVAAAPLIAHDVARSAALRAWIEGVKRASVSERVFMAIWRSAGSLGVAHQRGEQPVIVGDSAAEACVAFAGVLADVHPTLEGVVGPRLRFHMRDHLLRDLIAQPVVAGSMRVAIASDRDWVLEMHRAFANEARVAMTPESQHRFVDERLAAGTFRIWSDVEDVGLAGFVRAGAKAARVAPVYTRPAFRKRGYGAALVASLCAELIREERQLFLVTDLSNPTSNALYARLGFEPLGDFYTFDLVEPA